MCYNQGMDQSRKVFFTCDAGYIRPLQTVIYSLLRNADPTHRLTIYIAHEKSFIEKNCRQAITDLVSHFPFANIVFCDQTDLLKKYGDVFASELNLWAPIIWAGPLISDAVPPDVGGRIVYLDVDMLVLKDLGPLFDMDLGDAVAAAVTEGERRRFQNLIRCEWPKEAGNYYNNGTMVIDLDRYRAERIPERIVTWYAKYKDVAIRTDQDAQNAVFGARITPIHPRWNYNDGWLSRITRVTPFTRTLRAQPTRNVLEAILDPGVVHYINRKPWEFCHRPERKAYHRYMRDLGFFNPALEGRTARERLELLLYDLYNGLLRAYARFLLRFNAPTR